MFQTIYCIAFLIFEVTREDFQDRLAGDAYPQMQLFAHPNTLRSEIRETPRIPELPVEAAI